MRRSIDTRLAGIEEVKILNTAGTTTIHKTKNYYVISMSLWTLLFLLLVTFVLGIMFVARMFRPKYRYY